MANNQHKKSFEDLAEELRSEPYKTFGGYHVPMPDEMRRGVWGSDFFMKCRCCGKEERFQMAIMKWTADSTEDGMMTCSNECRTLVEIAR